MCIFHLFIYRIVQTQSAIITIIFDILRLLERTKHQCAGNPLFQVNSKDPGH